MFQRQNEQAVKFYCNNIKHIWPYLNLTRRRCSSQITSFIIAAITFIVVVCSCIVGARGNIMCSLLLFKLSGGIFVTLLRQIITLHLPYTFKAPLVIKIVLHCLECVKLFKLLQQEICKTFDILSFGNSKLQQNFQLDIN